MNVIGPRVVTQIVTCPRGARFVFKGILTGEPLAGVQIFLCPIHRDKIQIKTGLPSRKWYFEGILSEGRKTSPFSSYWDQFHKVFSKDYIRMENLPEAEKPRKLSIKPQEYLGPPYYKPQAK